VIRFNKDIQGTRDSDNYATPKAFYDGINKEFNFNFDPCPLKATVNGLNLSWIGNIFINPPYSNIKPFIEKGIAELKNGNAEKLVYLLPVRSDVKYWHELILKKASEIRFIKGRLNFNEAKTPAPFPTVLVIFENEADGLKIRSQ